MHKPLPAIDHDWTLFLDRDGVINQEKIGEYIHTWEEFNFYEGVIEAISKLSTLFGKVIVVTNQKGVARGVTKMADLEIIHTNMRSAIGQAGGRIDAIYACTDLDDSSPDRKPNPGMGHKAVKEFPSIDFERSIMVGNTLSDMKFGQQLGMFTVFLTTTRPEVDINDAHIDHVCSSLPQFEKELIAGKL